MIQKKTIKQSNKGFTLLELLIAFSILAIVVVPMLNLFVTGSRTNKKAREVIRATTTAQNMMEEMEASSVADLLRAVNGKTLDENGQMITVSLPGTGSFEATATGTAIGNYSYTGAGASSAIVDLLDASNAVVGSAFVPNATGQYSIVVPSVSNGVSQFDAVMTFKSDASKTLDNANILSMDRSDCGYYVQASDEAMNTAYAYANANVTYRSANPTAGITVMSADDFLTSMKRTLNVDIRRDNGTGAVTVDVSTSYDCGSNLVDVSEEVVTSTSPSIFDNYATGEELNSVYIYYYPLYNTGTSPRDTIVISNTAGIKTNVYLICMPEAVTYSAYNESNYKAKLELYDGTPIDVNKFNTKVMSNLANSKFTKDDHNATLTLAVGDLGNTTQEEIFYNVSIDLYKHNAASFTTNGSGASVFTPTSADFVTTFTGSLVDNSVTLQ